MSHIRKSRLGHGTTGVIACQASRSGKSSLAARADARLVNRRLLDPDKGEGRVIAVQSGQGQVLMETGEERWLPTSRIRRWLQPDVDALESQLVSHLNAGATAASDGPVPASSPPS